MRRTICFLVGILILGLGNGCTKAKEDIRFIGYYVSGSALALTEDAAEGLTHLHLAFLYPEEDGSLIGTDLFRTHCLQAARIQEENKELKILASVGGWGYSEAFEEIAKNPQSRRRFIEEILGWVEKYDLDGVDMDWEYPDGEQKGDFWQLITELRNALNLLEESEGREYLLSLAVPAFSSFPGEILMGEAVGDIDYWNLMTYDYHLGREGANAPLYDLQDECVARTVRAYEKTGIQKEALNLGIPLYGRGMPRRAGYRLLMMRFKRNTPAFNILIIRLRKLLIVCGETTGSPMTTRNPSARRRDTPGRKDWAASCFGNSQTIGKRSS